MDVVIVTGGASGIGAATSRLLTERGFRVVVADLQDELGEPLSEELNGLFVHHDVADPDSWEGLLTAAVDRFGPLFGLVAAAGVKSEYLLDSPPDPALFHRTAMVNQLGVILGVQAVGRHLRELGRGSIVNIASGAAMPPAQSPDLAYVSTKWGVRGVSRVAARQLAPYGVRVNTVLPGLIRTPMMATIIKNFPDRVAGIEAAIPMRRMGEPDDIARAVYFFISELGSYATGAELVVDGGSLA
ncbi:SDR family NAD(P)-dependent oxidoreductase [Streptomyces brasiliensis]|uniref:Dehydrogenase n=1 Tax=Streptomyces brasiliensis TaxID=1954 RepID=A0A917NYA6_9ACTN|nr:SDR family oxidoreductase [Streptomyces brasiliensis]GGJ41136.1 dehydrogenase [Streptomyces brasiliensis]